MSVATAMLFLRQERRNSYNPAKLQLFPFPSTSFLQISQRPPEPSPHLPQDLAEGLRQAGPHLAGDFFGDFLVVGFGEAAGDAGEGVAVAAERDGQNGVGCH